MSKAAAYWVKLNTDIWENNDAIKLIDSRPDADSILVIFFKLLTHAGKSNADGQLLINGFIPLEAEDLPGILKRSHEQIDKALSVLTKYGLVHTGDVVEIADWHEYVNVDTMAVLREKNAARVAKHREEKRKRQDVTLQQRYGNITVMENVTDIRTRELEKEELKDLKEPMPGKPDEPEPVKPPYDEIISHLNNAVNRKFKANGKTLQGWINARFKEGYTLEDFKTVIDKKTLEWLGTSHEQYLRPETLFISEHFDSYLNQPWPRGRGGNGGEANGNPGVTTGESLGQFVVG